MPNKLVEVVVSLKGAISDSAVVDGEGEGVGDVGVGDVGHVSNNLLQSGPTTPGPTGVPSPGQVSRYLLHIPVVSPVTTPSCSSLSFSSSSSSLSSLDVFV